MNRCALFTASICASLALVGAVSAAPQPKFADGVSETDRAVVTLTLEGWSDGRERLISGIARVTRETRMNLTRVSNTMMMAFDNSRSKLRFDETFDDGTTHLARTSKETLWYASGNHTIERNRPQHVPPVESAVPFEMNLVGMIMLCEMDVRLGVKDFMDYFNTITCTRCTRRPDQSIEVEFEHWVSKQEDRIARIVVFQPSQDFAPIEVRRVVLATLPGSGIKIGVMDEATTQWERKNDAWVPVKVDFEDRSTGEGATFLLHWSDVNQPIAERYFQVEGFDAPPDTPIMDARLGEPILEGHVGSKREIQRHEAKQEVHEAVNWRTWVVLGNIVAITILGVSLILRRIRS